MHCTYSMCTWTHTHTNQSLSGFLSPFSSYLCHIRKHKSNWTITTVFVTHKIVVFALFFGNRLTIQNTAMTFSNSIDTINAICYVWDTTAYRQQSHGGTERQPKEKSGNSGWLETRWNIQNIRKKMWGQSGMAKAVPFILFNKEIRENIIWNTIAWSGKY